MKFSFFLSFLSFFLFVLFMFINCATLPSIHRWCNICCLFPGDDSNKPLCLPSNPVTYICLMHVLYMSTVKSNKYSLNQIPREQAASKNLWAKKYTHIPGCQNSGAFHIRIEKNRVSHAYTFCWKKGAYHIPGSAEKGGHFGTHIRTMSYIGSYTSPTSRPKRVWGY